MFPWSKERPWLPKAVIFSFLSIVSFRGDRGHMKTVVTVVSHRQLLQALVSHTQNSEQGQKTQVYVAKGLDGKSRLVPSQPFALENRELVCFIFLFPFIIFFPFYLASASAPRSQISSWSEAPELNDSSSKLTLAWNRSRNRAVNHPVSLWHFKGAGNYFRARALSQQPPKAHLWACGRCSMAAACIWSKMLWERTSLASGEMSHRIHWMTMSWFPLLSLSMKMGAQVSARNISLTQNSFREWKTETEKHSIPADCSSLMEVSLNWWLHLKASALLCAGACTDMWNIFNQAFLRRIMIRCCLLPAIL